MKQIKLNVKSRELTGRTASKRLRTDGQIPAVMYGDSGVSTLQLDRTEFQLAWRGIAGRAALLELHKDGEAECTFAIIKEIQRNPRTDSFVHIDFKEIVRGQDMEAEVPVRVKGVAEGVKTFGGVLEVIVNHVKVRCRPRDLPEVIEVDVTQLMVGDSVHVAQLPVIENVTYLAKADTIFVTVLSPTVAEAAPAPVAAAAAAPAAAAKAAPAAKK